MKKPSRSFIYLHSCLNLPRQTDQNNLKGRPLKRDVEFFVVVKDTKDLKAKQNKELFCNLKITGEKRLSELTRFINQEEEEGRREKESEREWAG